MSCCTGNCNQGRWCDCAPHRVPSIVGVVLELAPFWLLAIIGWALWS